MKPIMMYECEICQDIYNDSDEAIECETLGKEKPLCKIGDFVDYEVQVGGGFDSFYVQLRVREIEENGHFIIYHFEEFDTDDEEWRESNYVLSGVFGNEMFNQKCTVQQIHNSK